MDIYFKVRFAFVKMYKEMPNKWSFEVIPLYFLHYWTCASFCKAAVTIAFGNLLCLQQTVCKICLLVIAEIADIQLQTKKV